VKRNVQDVAYLSGGAAITSGQSAFQAYADLEGFDATVLDSRALPAPAVGVGTLWVENFAYSGLSATPGGNQGDPLYIPSTVYGQALPMFSYGVLQSVPNPGPQGAAAGLGSSPGTTTGGQVSQLSIRQKGSVAALCTTPTGIAIAPGTLLTADGNNNLTPFLPPAAAPQPTVTPVGTTGAVTWTYGLVAVSTAGVYSAIGTVGSTATGNATLTNANYNAITWTPVADAAYYIVVRTVAGTSPNTTGVIGYTSAGDTQFNDTGLAILPNTSATQFAARTAAPATPTVTQVTGATAGAATWTYTVSAILPNGVYSAQSTAASVTTGNATLSPTNGNKIVGTAVTGAVLYAINRTVSGGTPTTTGLIGYCNAAQLVAGFVDYGQAATTFTAQTTPNPTPASGTVLAIAKGSLPAATTTPTLVLVNVGGY
jgi:hypothetical protein